MEVHVTTGKLIADILFFAVCSSCVGTFIREDKDPGHFHRSDERSRPDELAETNDRLPKEPILGYRNFSDPTIHIQSGL